jgi:cytochrome c556
MDAVDTRVEKFKAEVDKQFTQVDERFDQLESQVEDVKSRIGTVTSDTVKWHADSTERGYQMYLSAGRSWK